MATATPATQADETAARPVADALAALVLEMKARAMPDAAVDKARGCLTDFLACALEARDLPWSKQVAAYAGLGPRGPASIVGTELRVGAPEAAFANGTLGHGLVREDMHVPSCSHLGVVVWPSLLALAELEGADGIDGESLLKSGVIGYEVGARVGKALFDADLQSRIRPTGTIGAIAAAAAGAALLGLDRQQTVSALALAANAAGGLNEWPWTGGWDMFFHAGSAARGGVTAVLLGRGGAFGSPSAIEGRAGLFAAYGRRGQATSIDTDLPVDHEIMAVYWKPAPACNYVQTPCQAALGLVEDGVRAADIDRIDVASFTAAIEYPGCDHAGPFGGILDAKMSIQYSVAATFASGAIEEANYQRLDDAEVLRLARAVTLSRDPAFEAAYPTHQGVEIAVTLKDGTTRTRRMDDLVAFDHAGVRARFQKVATAQLDESAARRILSAVDGLSQGGSAGALTNMLARA